ncbi:aldehyde dehydrogenase family protein [Marinobacterium marinum]|uniref:aldehyde dehydrogenase (NAD(+)) n=1 Tax=Marinobacterium marinum TaxID=2756129 RepID=A0A7W1WYJ9_9GAMM|nr:aldehyde dehydrogenase family protein [Marinobacterium marinum]MBA4502576.1 aldehyde dehydrogenase family protein [Marinobacterium marinum]
MLEKREFYINGQWVAPLQPRDCEVIDPSTESVCAVISLGSQADTDAAVSSARQAFDSWSQTGKEERLALLEKLYTLYKSRSAEMAEAISLEMGAPIALAQTAQWGTGANHLKNFMRVLRNYEFEQPLGEHAPGNQILREPIGVCGLITPWNWPMNQVTLKVVAALAAGCTMVLKPSEIAPLSAMLFAEMIDEAGFPAGVFNLVNGDGPGVGTQLSGHPEVDMISFTGSTRAGIAISKNAADTVKRVSLELGGKGANIVFADADEKAVVRGVRHCFMNSGQSCNAPTRMLVERSIYEQAVQTAIEVAAKTEVNQASLEGKHIGPVVSAAQFDKIQGLIQQGIDEGARLVAGGLGKPDGMSEGYFVRPTVFADVTNEMSIAREEIFGPVLSIIPFDTEEEALRIANDSPYGLTHYVQTQDADKARRVARKLRSGMVQMNGEMLGGGAPFGGYKQSGNGREGGPWGLEEFLEVKVVTGWE